MTTTHTSPTGDPVARAFSAYFRTEGAQANQPSRDSGVQTHNDKQYVVLRNTRGVLAVYRILNSGALKRLRRWSPELEAY